MPIKSIEFTNLDARRFTKTMDRMVNLRVDDNSTVTVITQSAANLASVDFRFTANYRAAEAVIGLIQIEGTLLWEGDAKALVTGWSAGGQMPPEAANEIHATIMSNCIPEAIILAKELRLPPPIQMPQVNVAATVPPPNKKGRSPEVA